MGFELRARVQARATLFDEGTEDAQGRKYSEVRRGKGLGEFCLGTVTRVWAKKRTAAQKYQVKWDEGTSTSLEEEHLSLVAEANETAANADDEGSGLSDYLTRDGESTDGDEDEIEGATQGELMAGPEDVITPLNGVVQCGEYRWRRVKAIVGDPRAEHPEFDFATRNTTITENTSLNEILWLCMPNTRTQLLETVRYRAGSPLPKPYPVLILTLTLTVAFVPA